MKFKNYKEYFEARGMLLNEAQVLIEAGKTEEANAKMKEVEELDNSWDEFATAQANLNALNQSGRQVTDITALGSGKNTESAASVSFDSTGENSEKRELLDTDAYRKAWLHAMKGQALTTEETGLIDSVGSLYNVEKASEHQLVIPTTVRKGIWTKAEELHPVINDLSTTFVKGDIVIIKDTSAASDADWIDEDDESKDADFSEGEIRLTGCEISKSVTISWKLKKMNDQDYESYLIDRLAEKVGNTIAKALFTGKGKPAQEDTFKAQARGVLTALKAEKGTPRIVNYEDMIGYSDLTAVMAKVKGVYKSTGAFYATGNTIWTQLANILDKNGRPIFMPDSISANIVGRIFGVPVKEEDGMEDGSLLLGNYGKGYAFNFNETMSIYREDHVKTRKTDYMAYGIADGDLIDTEAFCLLRKNG